MRAPGFASALVVFLVGLYRLPDATLPGSALRIGPTVRKDGPTGARVDRRDSTVG